MTASGQLVERRNVSEPGRAMTLCRRACLIATGFLGASLSMFEQLHLDPAKIIITHEFCPFFRTASFYGLLVALNLVAQLQQRFQTNCAEVVPRQQSHR